MFRCKIKKEIKVAAKALNSLDNVSSSIESSSKPSKVKGLPVKAIGVDDNKII